RYYQDAAIRAVLEKIAQCETNNRPKRALLSLATGAGKTFIAVNLLKRISDAGQLTRALFVCDRDELRSQALRAFQNVFGSDAAEVFRRPDGTNNAKNARIHIATYQTLGVERDSDNANFLTTYYPEDYFSHIVIDECHRSAWGKWSQVLTRNRNAVHIGLTATPRRLEYKQDTDEARLDAEITANNIAYFGEPVYEYDIAQGIEDGYLAACEIVKCRVSLDNTGIVKEDIIGRHPVDAITGDFVSPEEISDFYHRYQFEDRILLPDRVRAMCQDLFNRLLETGGPEQKTIIFCVRDSHADAVAAEMNNLYAVWCARQGKPRLDFYAFKCTAASSGNDHLPEFRSSTRSHFVATTVDLLTTGVDVPCVRNIVFFRYLRSPIAFYQMIGRGTRIDPTTGKLMFRVYDYTDATRLFGKEFITKVSGSGGARRGPEPQVPHVPTIRVEGFDVHITDAGRYIVADVDGRAMPVPLEEYKARLAERLIHEVRTLEDFRSRWIDPPSRCELLDALVTSGYSPTLI
ncbi:MAG: restriction endonuclease subunit R, partial [Bacillaceae bacterium]|nr:restriction endonuclease subunit R [Bacillaceae bacterium]